MVIFLSLLLFWHESAYSQEKISSLNHIEELTLREEFDAARVLAEKVLNESSSLSKDTALYLNHKILWLLFKQEQYDQVIDKVEKASVKDAFSLLMQLESLKKTGNLKSAEALLQKILPQNDPQILAESGNIQLLQKKSALAKISYGQALDSCSENVEKESLFLKSGLVGVLENDPHIIDEALKSLPFSENPLNKSALLYLSAKKELMAGNKILAIKNLENALENELPYSLLNAVLLEYGQLSFSCLEDPDRSQNEKEVYFHKGCGAFKRLLQKDQKCAISLGRGYLIYGMNGGYLIKDDDLLKNLKEGKTPEHLRLADILEIEFSPDFATKEALYQSLEVKGPFTEESSMLRLQNLMKWGTFLVHKGFYQEGKDLLKKGADLTSACLEQGQFHQLKESAIYAFCELSSMADLNLKPAFAWLKTLKPSDKTAALLLFEEFKNNPSQKTADDLLSKAHFLNEVLIAKALFDQGFLSHAKSLLTSHSPEALFLSACIADQEGAIEDKQKYLKNLIDAYPDHPLIDNAEFMFYSVQEYLSGGRSEMKHLERIAKTRKDSLHTPLVYYLIGLDCKKDRKTAAGKWIRKKNLTDAIDAFTNASSSYENLKARCIVPHEQKQALDELAHLASFEQGSCNFEIAKASKGAKRKLYLEYSKEVFSTLSQKIQKSFPKLYKEALLLLSEVLIQLDDHDSAYTTLSQIIHEDESPYFLSKAHFLLADTLIKKREYTQALKSLAIAENDFGGFSSDEMLHVGMQKGFCLKALGKLDDAMMAFSTVVNANIVSSLRIEGMFERAAIYKDQNRYDLYRKQLEAILKLGGQWQSKARQLLDETNG